MVRFGGDQLIDHIHGSGKKNLDTRLYGCIADTLGEKGFTVM
jgi:hypothetical protein